MEIIGIGTDIVDLRRVREASFLDRIAEYVLLPEERAMLETSRDRVQFIASRFAAKEAVIKAFPASCSYQDLVITKDGDKPIVEFRRKDAGRYRAIVSMAHDPEHAIAFALLCA